MRSATLFLTAAALLTDPTGALAQQDAGPSTSQQGSVLAGQTTSGAAVVSPRRNVLAIEAGYGRAAEINGSVPADSSSLWIRWTHRTRAQFAGGEPAWGFELLPVVRISQEPTAFGAGGHLVYEHRFLPERWLRPVLRSGAGMVFTNRAVPVGETRYNFSLFAGAGLEIGVGRNRWLSIEYRLHHISNADTGNRNPGINSHTLGFGVAWAF